MPVAPQRLARLIAKRVAANNAFVANNIFGGPSLHFHKQALLRGTQGQPVPFAEAAYVNCGLELPTVADYLSP